jgi:hypothetical protein
VRLTVKVIPHAKQNKIVKEAERLKVYLTAPAVEGKANAALIEFLAEYYKVKRNQIKVVLGEKSRQKVVEIHFHTKLFGVGIKEQ